MLLTELRSYQGDAVAEALQWNGYCFFPEQRTGKCLCSLAVVDQIKPDVLIIFGPAMVMSTWDREIPKHLKIDWDMEVHQITFQQPVKDKQYRQDWYKYMIDSYKAGVRIMVIVDEAHGLKKPSSSQSEFARTLGKRACYRLALTGTPIDKGYEQFWAVFDFIEKGYLGTYGYFKEQYCEYAQIERRDGRIYPQLIGYRNVEELLEKIRKRFYRITFNAARRSMGKKPVRIKRKKVYFDLNKKSKDLYKELKKEMTIRIGELDVNVPLPVTLPQKLQQICGGFLLHQTRMPGERKKRRMVVKTGHEKILAMMELLSGLGKEKVVICARFTHEIEAIRETLDEWGWTHKEISGKSKWDHDFNVDVVVMQVKSGVGFDLSEADTYIFYSWDHSYITFEQARMRIMSMEHTEWVNYFFLIARDTIEEDYYEAPIRKKDFSALVLDHYRPEKKAKKRRRANPKGARRVRKGNRTPRDHDYETEREEDEVHEAHGWGN